MFLWLAALKSSNPANQSNNKAVEASDLAVAILLI